MSPLSSPVTQAAFLFSVQAGFGQFPVDQKGWRSKRDLFPLLRPYFSPSFSEATIRCEINKTVKVHFSPAKTTNKASSFLGQGVLLIPTKATMDFCVPLVEPASRSDWEAGPAPTRYRNQLEGGCSEASLSRLSRSDLLLRVIKAMAQEGYWVGRKPEIEKELHNAVSDYSDHRSQSAHMKRMVDKIVRRVCAILPGTTHIYKHLLKETEHNASSHQSTSTETDNVQELSEDMAPGVTEIEGGVTFNETEHNASGQQSTSTEPSNVQEPEEGTTVDSGNYEEGGATQIEHDSFNCQAEQPEKAEFMAYDGLVDPSRVQRFKANKRIHCIKISDVARLQQPSFIKKKRRKRRRIH